MLLWSLGPLQPGLQFDAKASVRLERPPGMELAHEN